MSSARFTCPACQKTITSARPVPDGTRLTCPGCKTGFTAGGPTGLPVAARVVAPPPADAFEFGDDPPTAAPVARSRRPAAQRRSPVPLIAGGVAAVLLVVGAGGGLYWWANDKPDVPQLKTGVAKAAPSKPAPAKPAKPTKPDEESAPAAPEKPAETKPAAPPSFADWEQDFEAAKKKAAAEKKDLLVLFNGSDWCVYCRKLTAEVLHTPVFRDAVDGQYVLVNIDFPRGEAGKRQVADPARNDKLQRRFDVDGYPQVVLADADGRPYAVTGYQRGGASAYVGHLDGLRTARDRRDELFADVAEADAGTRASAVKAALAFLAERGLAPHYLPQLRDWGRQLRAESAADPTGEQIFLTAAELGLDRAADDKAAAAAVAADLDGWKKEHGFKAADPAATLYLRAGYTLGVAGDPKRAADCFKAGLGCGPTEPRVKDALAKAAAGRLPLGSGSGFVVADGYALTNHHVVDGPGRLMVQPDGAAEPVPAEVVAKDEGRDMALVKFAPPAAARVRPLPLAGADPPAVGEDVAALGFPLGDTLGGGLKLTPGAVSGGPEAAVGGMLILSNTVNPGNSGGPLCDAAGRVVGMVTAKTASDRGRTSYGLARPAADLGAFLAANLPGYKPAAPPPAKKQAWSEVNKQVRPGVLMVLRML